jgi:hypothetical protein
VERVKDGISRSVEELRDGRELHQIRHDAGRVGSYFGKRELSASAIVRRNGNGMDLSISDEERKMK